MIITCNECDTRFNLDESLLKQTGSKVRCAKCNNIFTAYPSSLSEESGKSGEVETKSGAAITGEGIESNEQYKVEESAIEFQEEIDFSDIDNFLEMNTELKNEKEPKELDLEIDETLAEPETELELESDDKIRPEISAEDESEGIDDEESDLELELELDEPSAETKFEIDFELDMEPELHTENEIDETLAEPETELELESDDKISPELNAEDEPEGIDREPETKLEESKQKDEESDLELDMELDEPSAETKFEVDFELDMEPEIDKNKQEDIDQDETIEKYTAAKIAEEKENSKTFNLGTLSDEQENEKGASIEESKSQKTAAKKRISNKKPILLLLVATLLIGGAYGTYVLLESIGIKIPFVVSNLLKPEVQDAGNLKIYISDINNKFVENSKIGKLLVITGKAKNEYSDARSYISIISKLYTKGKILSKTKTVYCGTVLAELDLINMELDSINNRLSNRFGDNKSNVRVKAGATIPFMVVFDDLPENLDEFTIEVAKSLPL